MVKVKRFAILSTVVAVGVSAGTLADVDLVTIPRRESTQLTIYNSRDITMVRDQRLLTLKQGINRIQFSWANTLIDPTSIDFRILDRQDEVDLIDTTFPANRNDALQWNIRSRLEGKLPVEIRYFTSGITWSADYVGIANEDETSLDITGYVRVLNNSGELYDNAQTRMVVGKISLVENIADLATRPPAGWNELKLKLPKPLFVGTPANYRRLEMDYDAYEYSRQNGKLQNGLLIAKEKEVKKEGLSEYFLFTIEGREDIRNKEPKRLIALKVKDVPLECIYKLTDRDGGTQFTKYYRFKNGELLDDAGKEKDLPAMENLGLSPLPDGMVRLFSQYRNKDLAYVGGTSVKYVPIGDRVEVDVGRDADITMIRRLKGQWIDRVIARQYRRRLDNTWVLYYDLVDYDETFSYEEELVSGKPVDVKAEIERRFDANVILWSNGPKPADWDSDEPGAYVDLRGVERKIEKVDQNHVKYFPDLKPGQKRLVRYSVTYKRRKVGPELNPDKRREPL